MASIQNEPPVAAETVAEAQREEEEAPLLHNEERPSLYQTISRRSETEHHLPPDGADVESSKSTSGQTQAGVYTTISVLLLGTFISQIDFSFVMATYGQVSSEFNDWESGTWLMTAYILATCVAQPLYGKLGDIYGRKSCLQAAYVLFCVGTAVAGLGRSMQEVIAGRAIQGAGGAGMLSMVSIIITDLVPVHDVARLRSYVNVIQTSGRSIGGVIGGALTQTLGWRWAFLVQIPPTILAIGLVQWKLRVPSKHVRTEESSWQKLKRVDFIGAAFLCYAIFSLCFVLDMGGQKYPWDSSLVISFIASGVASIILFIISARYVPEPIFPLRLAIHYDVVTNYAIIVLQVIVQFSLMMSVPIYFQAVRKASTAEAGVYLIPAFVGNTAGGLLSGHWIRRTGRYKFMTVMAPIFSVGCMALCLTVWQGGRSPWQSLTVLPGGFGQGAVSSSAFVGLAAGLPSEDVAVAASGMYLFFNIGSIVGVSAGAAVFQTSLRPNLEAALDGYENKTQIIRKLLESIDNVQHLSDKIRAVVLPAYVSSFHTVSVLGLSCAIVSFCISVFTRQEKLNRK